MHPDDEKPENETIVPTEKPSQFTAPKLGQSALLSSQASELLWQTYSITTRIAAEFYERLVAEVEAFKETSKGIDYDNLFKGDYAATTLQWAVRLAVETIDEDKRQLLRNAVLNAALNDAPAPNLRDTFRDFAASITPTHVQILQLLQQSGPIFENNVNEFLSTGLPKYRLHQQLPRVFFDDLVAKGLIEMNEYSPSNTVHLRPKYRNGAPDFESHSYGGLPGARSEEYEFDIPQTNRIVSIGALGDEFLKYISEPERNASSDEVSGSSPNPSSE